MRKPLLGISLMCDKDFLGASMPLFQNGQIDVIEWSFDTISPKNNEPEWLSGLLDAFSDEGKLLGHGVHYSLFDAKWTERQDLWLSYLKKQVAKRGYNHISEHFGFMSSANYHNGFPLPVSLNENTLKIGIDRLKRLQDAAQLPIGIENLAFSFAKNDVCKQGEFIEKMIDTINGFIILDLHNIYCQAHNFDIEIMDLVDYYPLNKVKEIHISGGSWQESIYQKKKKIRRDTHNGNIPNEIFDILPSVLAKCVNTEFVIFERLGGTFQKDEDVLDYQNDYLQLKKIVDNQTYINPLKSWNVMPNNILPLDEIPINDPLLYKEQQTLVAVILELKDYDKIKQMIFNNWDTTTWDIEMINTAIQIGKKWNPQLA